MSTITAPPDTASAASRRAAARRRDACWLLLAAVLGAVLATLATWSAPRYEARAEILMTGLQGPGRTSLYAVDQYVVDRMETWAAVAESGMVAARAGELLGVPAEALDGRVEAEAPPTLTLVEITVSAADPDAAVRAADAVATATAEVVNAEETPPGVPTPRALAQVVTVDEAVDVRYLDLRLAAVLGGVLGLLTAWLVLAVRRPGGWSRRLLPPVRPADRPEQLARIDQSVQYEVLGGLLLGQSWRGVVIVALALFGVFGYAYTGSFLPPLLVVLLAAIPARKDLRYAAGAILFAGVGVLPARVDLFPVAGLTPTVLEVAVAVGVVLTLLNSSAERLRGVFTWPVLAVVGAVLVGSVVGVVNGAELDELTVPVRAMLTVLAFFVFREAFRGRPNQLLGFLLVAAWLATVVALLAAPLQLELLQERSRDYVVTAGETADVLRISTPVLDLWTPLLVVLAAGVLRLRPRWLWIPVLVPPVLLVGLSFNRTTWAVLGLVAVLVAVLRGGHRQLVQRATALAVVGVVGLAALSSGLLGGEGEAIAQRATSVVTGSALGEDSLSDRLQENEHAWATLRESPFVGTGVAAPYGATVNTYDEVMDVVVASDRIYLHQQYLRIWLWMGVLGLLAYGAVVVRLVALAVHDRMRRGQASVVTVSAGVGLFAVALESLFMTNLDAPSVVITVAIVLALMELAGSRTDGPVVPVPSQLRWPSGPVRPDVVPVKE